MTKMLEACYKSIGFVEGKNNDNPYGKKYGLNNVSYCSLFLSYKAEEVGIDFFKKIKDKTGKYFLAGCTKDYCAYVPSVYTYVKRVGLLKTDPVKSPPKAGDIIMFNMNTYKDGIRWSDHIGIIESYDPKTKIFHTIEANTSVKKFGVGRIEVEGGGVARKNRYIQNITGWFTIPI